MDDHTAISAPEGPDTPPAAPEPARAVIEAQMAMLGRLAELGMDVAEAVGRQARGEVAPDDAAAPVFPDLALAYSRASRAVRMTLALQSRLIETLERLESGQGIDVAVGDARARAARETRVDRLERIVGRIAREQETEAGVERILDEAVERLYDEDLYGDLVSRPFSEIVDQICRDLRLDPDWPSLAKEPWALKELASEAVGAPLAGLAAPAPPPSPRAAPRHHPPAGGGGPASPAGGGGGPRSGGGGANVAAAPAAAA